MTFRSSAARLLLAVLLTLVLTLSGAGRGWAAAPHASDGPPSIPGLTFHICHAGEASPPLGDPQHDCCDDCALLAVVTLPGAPIVTGPAPVAHFVDHAAALPWAPAIARLHSPRSSQGPPLRVI